jgi:flavin reductase (DIM6/NTAB) family NADH-FMN oxidoreductase RutF
MVGTDPVGPIPAGRDPEAYDRLRRRVLWAMPTGLFVVGSRSGERRNLMTANWVMQVAITPKLVAVALESGSVTRALVEESGFFSVNMIAVRDRALVRRFVKPVREVELDADGVAVSLQGEAVHEVTGGLPCLVGALAWLACEVRDVRSAAGGGEEASHVLVVGQVVDVGATVPAPGQGDGDEMDAGRALRMGDTRMSYGG